MKLTKLLVILSLLFTITSCIKQQPKKGYDANIIESMDKPRVIRDTIIIRDTVVKPVQELAQVEEPKAQKSSPTQQATTSTRNYRNDNNDYDPSNSGFFDKYLENYSGDPNRNKKPIVTKKIVESSSGELERKKEAIEKSLELLEQRNEEEQKRYEQLEQERKEFNERAIREAKEQQKKQVQQKQSRSKTLDTDLFLDNK